MATILTQQTDPWGAVAANLAGNLIQNMIQRSQEAERNKKMNAFLGEVMNAGQAQNQGLMQNINAVPDGYNTDPWAAAMHKNYSPMTQFNMGTADITPFAQQNSVPTVQDIRNAVAANLANKRFGMLDPAAVEKMMDPYYQQAQKAQQDALRKEYADKFMNAGNVDERRNIAWGGAIQDPSVVPFDFLQEAQRQYQYETPSASDLMTNDYRNRQFNEDVRQFDVRTAENARQFNATRGDNNYWRGVEQSNIEYNRNNPGYGSIIQGEDGGQWAVDSQGNTKKIYTGEYPSGAFTFDEQNQINNAMAAIDKLEQQNLKLREMRDKLLPLVNNGSEGEVNTNIQGIITRYEEDIADNMLEIRRYQNMINKIHRDAETRGQQIRDRDVLPAGFEKKTGEDNDIGLLILDGTGAKAHPHGTFHYDRGDHLHDGTDYYSIKEGTNIPVHAEMGENPTVTEVGFDKGKNGKGGYGNYVKVEADKNGHKVEYLFGHLQDKSIKVKQGQQVKAGDIIANVGSTGRSSGPHLHLRVKVDGKSVDPQKFLSNYGNSTKQGAGAENSKIEISPEKQKEYEAAYKKYYEECKAKGYTDEQIKEFWELTGNPPMEIKDEITSADVTPPFPTQSEDIKQQQDVNNSTYYGLDKRKFRSK